MNAEALAARLRSGARGAARARWAVELALVAAMAWVAAGIVTPHAPLKSHVSGAGATTDESRSGREAAALLARVPLFGKEQKPAPVARPKARPVAASRLNIQLLGAVAAGSRSWAVVRLPSGEEKAAPLGANLMPGVKLERVAPRAIVVRHAGRLERIEMKRRTLAGARVAAGLSSPAPKAGGRRVFRRAEVQRQLANLPALLTSARAVPHMNGGSMDGFQLTEIAPGSLAAQAGLQNGDVVQAVNGRPLHSVADGAALLQQVQQARSLDIDILRRGASLRLHYDIR